MPHSKSQAPSSDDEKSVTAGELLPQIYQELRQLAAQRLSREPAGQTLQPTALVHEAWLRLAGKEPWNPPFANKAHFFAAAAEAMRQILIDRARRKKALKRGGGAQKISLEEVDLAENATGDTLILVDAALEKLAEQDPLSAQLVKLRFFTGLTYEQAAEALGVSERTAKRCWTFARAWLYREIAGAIEE